MASSAVTCGFLLIMQSMKCSSIWRCPQTRIHVVKAERKKGQTKKQKVYWVAGLKGLSLSELLEFS